MNKLAYNTLAAFAATGMHKTAGPADAAAKYLSDPENIKDLAIGLGTGIGTYALTGLTPLKKSKAARILAALTAGGGAAYFGKDIRGIGNQAVAGVKSLITNPKQLTRAEQRAAVAAASEKERAVELKQLQDQVTQETTDIKEDFLDYKERENQARLNAEHAAKMRDLAAEPGRVLEQQREQWKQEIAEPMTRATEAAEAAAAQEAKLRQEIADIDKRPNWFTRKYVNEPVSAWRAWNNWLGDTLTGAFITDEEEERIRKTLAAMQAGVTARDERNKANLAAELLGKGVPTWQVNKAVANIHNHEGETY